MSSSTTWGPAQREREHALLADLAQLPHDDPRRGAIRDELVQMHLPLVRHLALRYRDRGESVDDLIQVGTIGLLSAIDRYDGSRGTELSTFATPTILGEIRRHFRDHAWAVRVPRRLQELQAKVAIAADALTGELNRAPTVRELADRLGITQEDVLEALEARHAYSADSLDPDPEGIAGVDLAESEPAFEAIEDRATLLPLLDALPVREKQIIRLRFEDNLSQSQIADRLGISQMHVSRLLARSLQELRQGMLAD